VASQELRTVANYIDEYRSMASAGEITPEEAVDLASLKTGELGTVLDLAIDAESPQERMP
jgi:hypothetical protein